MADFNPYDITKNSFGAGGIESFFDPAGIFQTPPNPADAGMGYLNQATQQLPGYFQPYMNAGQSFLPQLQSQYGQLMSNPGGALNRMGANFQQSPGYQWDVNQALGAANRAAAAGGMLGSPQEQQNIAGTVNQMANQDYYNWMNHAMSMYNTGLQGAQNMYGIGYDASKNLGEDLANIYQSQAQLGYAGQANQNQASQGMLGNVLGAAGMVAAFL